MDLSPPPFTVTMFYMCVCVRVCCFIKDYSVMLVIPDNFVHGNVKLMMEVLMRDLSFKSVILLTVSVASPSPDFLFSPQLLITSYFGMQSSVAATLGAGLSSACIVDAGAQKVSVVCVDEATAIPSSCRFLAAGGDDMTIFWHSLLKEASFPFFDCNLSLPADFDTLNRMKETLCNFSEDVGARNFDLYIRRPRQSTLLYDVRVFDEVIKAPLGLFHPELLLDCRLKTSPPAATQAYDPEDCFDRQFLSEVRFVLFLRGLRLC